jgi:hypothetical protein
MDDRELAAFERNLQAFRPRAPGPLPARRRSFLVSGAFFLGLAAAVALFTSIPHFMRWNNPTPRINILIGEPLPVASRTIPDVSLAALRRAARGDRGLADVLDAAAPRLLRAVGGEDSRAR